MGAAAREAGPAHRRADGVARRRRASRAPRRLALGTAAALALVGLAALAALAAPATADGDVADADAPSAEKTGLGLDLTIGYGEGFAPRSKQQGRDVADVRVVTLAPRVRTTLARAGDGHAWYHGDLDGTLEALLMINTSPSAGVAGGANAGLRYRFRRTARWQPFVDGAIGIGGLDFDLAAQDDGFTFFLQAGTGLRWRVAERFWLVGSVRWQHVSNAQTHLPNAGIDTIGVTLGLERDLAPKPGAPAASASAGRLP